jgi:hypothetical protein
MLQLIDGRTLFLTGALIAGAFAPILFGIMLVRKTYPGYGYWASSELAFAVLFLMQALRDLISEAVVIVLGNLTMGCSMVLLAQGIRKFCGRRDRGAWIYAASAVVILVILYFYFVHQDLRVRAILAPIWH